MPATGATTRMSRTTFCAVRSRASDAARRARAASALCCEVRMSRSAMAPALNSTAFCSAVHFCVSKSLCVARRSASADASAASCSVDSNFASSCPAFTVWPSRTSTDSRIPSLRVRTAIVSIGRRSPEIGRPASMLPRPTLYTSVAERITEAVRSPPPPRPPLPALPSPPPPLAPRPCLASVPASAFLPSPCGACAPVNDGATNSPSANISASVWER